MPCWCADWRLAEYEVNHSAKHFDVHDSGPYRCRCRVEVDTIAKSARFGRRRWLMIGRRLRIHDDAVCDTAVMGCSLFSKVAVWEMDHFSMVDACLSKTMQNLVLPGDSGCHECDAPQAALHIRPLFLGAVFCSSQNFTENGIQQ